MVVKEELKQILKELNRRGDVARAREEASEFLKNVDGKTLSEAEQELLEEGAVTQDDLRKLCGLHLAVLGEGLEEQKPQLEEGHPVRTLMAEHEIILRNLEELRQIVEQAEASQGFIDIAADRLPRLREISDLLLETESHHQREEEALFPRLEREGITGPPRIMRLEHEELRAKKKELAELLRHVDEMEFPEFVHALRRTGGYLAGTLKDHIFKEDNILYPTALQTLGPEEWREVLGECDTIGYCYFTPGTDQ